jgi:hypothetical protein
VRSAKLSLIAVSAASVALSACATPGSSPSPAGTFGVPASSATGIGQRDLTPQEKKIIVDAVGPSLRNAATAKYKWTSFPLVVAEDSVNYCATVDAQSPFPAYSGHQAYIVEAKVIGGHVASAVIGLIAGGKDFALVTGMCEKYGLDPRKAS